MISQDLAGPVGLFVKFSVLQEYGVDRVFLLENANVDSSQRNVVFVVHSEKVRHVRTVAGMFLACISSFVALLALLQQAFHHDGTTVDYADLRTTLRSQSEIPISTLMYNIIGAHP